MVNINKTLINIETLKKSIIFDKSLKKVNYGYGFTNKKKLISRIKDSKDLSFLRALQTIFDASEQALFQLTPEQSKSIEIGHDEIENGNYFENNDVISEMREWLEKK